MTDSNTIFVFKVVTLYKYEIVDIQYIADKKKGFGFFIRHTFEEFFEKCTEEFGYNATYVNSVPDKKHYRFKDEGEPLEEYQYKKFLDLVDLLKS
jgi:hypothetical protein